MRLYKVFGYTTQQIVDVEYLLEQAERFDILDRVEDALFQFSPRLTGECNTCHEPWAVFHKHCIINEIVFYLLEQLFEDDYELANEIDEQIYNETYTEFILKNDLRELSDNEVLEQFRLSYF